jgi:exopolysaccharide biosynthesis polyprenyl glycosylphosphotransferase
MSLVQAEGCASPAEGFMIMKTEAERSSLAAPLFPHGKGQLRLALFSALLLLDVLCIVVAFQFAERVRLGSIFGLDGWRTLAIVLPTFIPIALNNRAYSIEALKRPTLGARRALEALLCATGVALALLFFLKIGVQFSRLLFAIGTITALALTVTGRIALGRALCKAYKWRFSNELVLADGIHVNANRGELVLNPLDLGIQPLSNNPMMLDRLARLLTNCDRLIILCPPQRRAAWISTLRGTNLNVEIAMPELGAMGGMAVGRFQGDLTLLVNSGRLSLRDRVLKRALDLVGALAALILVGPLMLAVAVAIAVESPGSIFFRQRRLGQNNRIFYVLKFRSMKVECTDSQGDRSASVDDDRVTRVGRFIRKTSIDELPQLFNVLMGHMSIVGPRPHALGSTAENLLFWQIDPGYFDRHAIKPGITGLAQVRGFRGATARRTDVTSRLKSDLEYVVGWSIWRDLKIIFVTFRVLIHPNAF